MSGMGGERHGWGAAWAGSGIGGIFRGITVIGRTRPITGGSDKMGEETCNCVGGLVFLDKDSRDGQHYEVIVFLVFRVDAF